VDINVPITRLITIFKNQEKLKLIPKSNQLIFFPSKLERGGLEPADLGYIAMLTIEEII
jgi:hypothetical protein